MVERPIPSGAAAALLEGDVRVARQRIDADLTPEQRKIRKIRRRSNSRIRAWQRNLTRKIKREKRRRQERIEAIRDRAADDQLVPDEAVDFVAHWEGWLPTAYADMGGVWTIGYGHTGPDVRPGMSISHDEGLRLLAADMKFSAEAVDELVRVPLSVHQRSALISFTFNCGRGALATSTLLARVNAGASAAQIRDAFLMWVKVNGATVQGLVNRRSAEADLFNR